LRVVGYLHSHQGSPRNHHLTMRGQIWLVVNTNTPNTKPCNIHTIKKWMMLASWWSGSSWSSHYHKGLTHHSYDCTSGEFGQNQIQTTKKTNTNYKKDKHKLQKNKKDKTTTLCKNLDQQQKTITYFSVLMSSVWTVWNSPNQWQNLQIRKNDCSHPLHNNVKKFTKQIRIMTNTKLVLVVATGSFLQMSFSLARWSRKDFWYVSDAFLDFNIGPGSPSPSPVGRSKAPRPSSSCSIS